VLAKGVEDTAFYRYFRLTALNEVGGDPGRFSIGPDELHAAALERFARHPLQLLASQTHDTKRAGDVRARIGALAGMPERWGERVRRWRELTGGLEDPNEEYLVWQTLVGAWPIVPPRLELYLEKALREASGRPAGSTRTSTTRSACARSSGRSTRTARSSTTSSPSPRT
jgi:Maltooligosyl trehalose synthase